MGVQTDKVTPSLVAIHRLLGYKPSNPQSISAEFRELCTSLGPRAVEHCAKIISHERHDSVQSKHSRLLGLMRMLARTKTPGTKYRNPQVQQAKWVGEMLDQQAMDRIAREL